MFIAHRGNTMGPHPDRENTEPYVLDALHHGFDVEVDVWNIHGSWWLGHDRPTVPTSLSFLQTNGLWCHAKNLHALTELVRYSIHTFSHDQDPVVLTSRGFPWVFPGQPLNSDCICVMPERGSYSLTELSTCKGICSDYVYRYKYQGTVC